MVRPQAYKKIKGHWADFGKLASRRSSFVVMICALVLALICSIGLALSMGQVSVSFSDAMQIVVNQMFGISLDHLDGTLPAGAVDIIWNIRFPRVLLAMIVGAGLALCGTVMQAFVQNPLADPYILGISSGASLGATFSIMLGIGTASLAGSMGVAFWAFIGALGAAGAVMILANLGGKISSAKLVLMGTVVNALCSACSNFIIYMASNSEGIRSVTFWTMGSLASAHWDSLPLVGSITAAAAFFFIVQSRVLNTMLMGDEAAVTLGMNMKAYRGLYMVISSVLTGTLVATCGIIGFVGLIIPHIARSMVGSDHKRLLPVSILFSAIFLIWTDVLARTVIPNSELPIGIVTALLGAPMLMYMLLKKNYGFGGN